MSLAAITTLYAAFARLDGDAMAACYARAAQFADEVFTLQGRRQMGGMWRMLCGATRARGFADWKLETSGIGEQGGKGRAHWGAHREAHYRFSATGRPAHNIIDAESEFDSAGLPGLLPGWTPFLRAKMRAQAAANLQRFLDQPV